MLEIDNDDGLVVASIKLPVFLLLRYIKTPIQIQIRFQYRSSMLLVL